MLRRARPGLRLLVVLLAVPLLGASCDKRPNPGIATPLNGTFTSAGSILVTGTVSGNLTKLAELTVNGVPTPLSGRSYSATVTLDPATVFNPIVVEARRTDGSRSRARVTVIVGESIPDGGLTEMGLGMRLNDSGLDALESSLGELVDLDLATLLPVGTTVISDCFVPGPFGTCLGSANVSIQNPPPVISGFGIAIDSVTNAVIGDITVHDLEVNLSINGSGLVPDCGLELTADSTDIDGRYGLTADSVDPSNVDVYQDTAPAVSFVSFDQSYTSGVCDWPIIGDIVQLIIGDLEPTVVDGLEDYLDDPDGSGPQDGPVAEAIETALAGISIAGPIGEAIGVSLEAPLFDVYEDPAGITLDSDARITALLPTPGAPDLTASYHLTEAFPTFGATTQTGGLPYGLALAISSSAFNQLLKAETESGLLRSSITEIDIGAGPLPLTPANISAFLPQLGSMNPDEPLRIDIEPTLAPVVTGQAGPSGELSDLRLGHLTAKLVKASNGAVLIGAAIDVRVGMDVEFAGGQLGFLLGELVPANLKVTILQNNIAAIDAQLSALLMFLVPELFPTLAGSLGSFPIPSFLGFELSPVEAGKAGDFLAIYADLVPAP
jgi:LBP / BPI / CETP family, C-terminal domain